MKLPSQTEIAFFGRITAGVTHELKNVLAIINEASGLMQDLMALSGEKPAYQDRFQKAFSSIKNQIQRGQNLIVKLNQFAHAPDTPAQTVDLCETAGNLAMLAQRFAALKNVSLKLAPPKSASSVQGTLNLVHFQMALFAAIECWLSVAAPGSEISIQIAEVENCGALRLACEGNLPLGSDPAAGLTAAEKWPLLLAAAAALGGSVAIDAQDPAILVRLPLKPPPEAPAERP